MVELGGRRDAALHGVADVVLVVGQPELEGRGGPEDLLGARGVLHAGQLDHDPAFALLLDHRLGDAELVDAVAQRGQVLLQRELLQLLHCGLRHPQLEHHITPALGLGHQQVGEVPANQVVGLLAGLGVGEGHQDDPALGEGDRLVTQLFVAQQLAQVVDVALLGLAHGRRHVHLEKEVHPAAQVEAEVHGPRPQGLEPAGGRGGEVQGDHVGLADRAAHDVLRPQLDLGVPEAHQQPSLADLCLLRSELGLPEGVEDALLQGLVDAPAPQGGYLDRRVLAVEVGQRVDRPHDGDDHDQDVLPEGVAVQHDGARLRGSSSCPWA